MLRSLYSSISGMKNMQTKLDVIGNNISNVNTYGFKKSRVTFKDAINQTISYASRPTETLGGKNAQQVGLGIETGSIDTVFTEGSLQTTGRALDLAISGGDGYFVVRNGSNNYFTRAGNFYIDEQGFLVNSDGNFVLAYDAYSHTLSQIQVPKKIPSNSFKLIGNLDRNFSYSRTVFDTNLNAHSINFEFEKIGNSNTWNVTLQVGGNTVGSFKAIFDEKTGEFKNVDLNGLVTKSGSFSFQLDDGRGGLVEVALDIDLTDVTSISSSNTSADAKGSNVTLTGGLLWEDNAPSPINITVSDGLKEEDITIEFSKGSRNDTVTKWNVTMGDVVPNTVELTFDNITGDLISINGSSTNLDSFPFTSEDGMNFTIDFTNLFSTSNNFSFNADIAELQEYSISGNGDFIVQYSDGSVRRIATLALARFNNPEGLTKIGGNLFNVSENSGDPIFGNGGAGFGIIESGKLEMSNVDLTEEFTEMIVAQRAFQSNSRIITTSDEILQEIVNLKR